MLPLPAHFLGFASGIGSVELGINSKVDGDYMLDYRGHMATGLSTLVDSVC